jgi:hypothetical protein
VAHKGQLGIERDAVSARGWFLALRLSLMLITVAAFVLAGVVGSPIREVFIVFGIVIGAAWLIGNLVSLHLRRQDVRRMLEARGTGESHHSSSS